MQTPMTIGRRRTNRARNAIARIRRADKVEGEALHRRRQGDICPRARADAHAKTHALRYFVKGKFACHAIIPRDSRAFSPLFEPGGDFRRQSVESRPEVVTEIGSPRDDGNGNEAYDQAIFDRGCAALTMVEARQLLVHGSHSRSAVLPLIGSQRQFLTRSDLSSCEAVTLIFV